MPRTIQIDDDLYEFLRQQADFGESESVVLRRLLTPASVPVPLITANGKHPGATSATQTIECPTCGKTTEAGKTFLIGGKNVQSLMCGHFLHDGTSVGDARTAGGVAKSALLLLVDDAVFRCQNGTKKYLGILAFAFKEKGKAFDKLLNLSGRTRKFFGRSREEIERPGTRSTHPRPIPDSGYWALTNADTIQKQEMLSKALRVLGYSPEEIRAAADAIS